MKKRYNIDDIKQFFEQFKQLPEYYGLEKVRLVINNPQAYAKPTIRANIVHLKYIIITSAIITSVLILFFFMRQPESAPISNHSVDTQKAESTKIPTENKTTKATLLSGQKQLSNTSSDTLTSPAEKEDIPDSTNKNVNCNWPQDTVVDKHSLLAYLTRKELLKLGVFVNKNRLYYYNKSKNRTSIRMINAKADPQKFTTFDFNLFYLSDTACSTYRWGHKFYNQIDRLVPVVAEVGNTPKILWFPPKHSFFKALPERYQYLEGIYQEIKCVKRRNPQHQIVHYCDPKKNLILDSINYLRLAKEELQKIGVGIFKDSIILEDSTHTFRYKLRKNTGSHGTKWKKGETIPEIPHMFPVLITDVKGLNQASYGLWADRQTQKNNRNTSGICNTLIPVLLPVSDFIANRKYALVLWYYPSDEFLKALPKRYSNDIKAEIEYINSDEKTGQPSCTYFEACKSTLITNELKIFPNPATTNATLEFTLLADVNGKILLVNIGGVELRLLIPQTRFLAGFNSFNLNLNDVIPGIYLVSIITDKGFKTQRIIISR